MSDIKAEESQNSRNPLGAIILITLGVLLLLSNFGYLSTNIWWTLLRLWPFIIVLVGLRLILGKSQVANWVLTLIGLAMMIVIITFATNEGLNKWMNEKLHMNSNTSTSASLQESEATVSQKEYSNVNKRSLDISIGTAQFTLADTTGTDYLKVNSKYYDGFGNPKLNKNFSNGTLDLNFSTENESTFNLGWMLNPSEREYNLTLGQPAIPTDVKVELGTGKGSIDLSSVKVNDFDTQVGTGSLEVEFSSQSLPNNKSSLEVGTGSITITLPKDAGIKINPTIGLGKIDVDGYNLTDDQTYTSNNYNSAAKKAEFTLNVGTGSITVNTK